MVAGLLTDEREYSLLHLAAELGKLELADFLLDICDINYSVHGKMAIDLAYEKEHFETVLMLLKNNSRFPLNFSIPKDFEMPVGLKKFIDVCKTIHEAITKHDIETVSSIIDEYFNLNFFYNLKNHSALAIALTSKSFEIYKMLMEKNVILGPHEIITDLLLKLSETERENLSAMNLSTFQSVADKHILTLMAYTQVGSDDNRRQERLNLVCSAFQRLNTLPCVKILLQIVAATRNFQLIFDFNHEHIHFLEPSSEGYSTGLFQLCGRIYIGAMHLLDPSRAHEVLGVIAHEFCHFVMFTVFGNMAKPYRVDDLKSQEEFDKILAYCESKPDLEMIIDLVFKDYQKEQQAAELIVRIPQALAHYIDDPERLEEFNEKFKDLKNFYDKCVPIMEEKLPEIERESENNIRRQYATPLNLLKLYWKRILFILLMAACSVSIYFLAISCIFKTCGSDANAFCEFDGKAVCKCSNDLEWEAGGCFRCVHDDHCPNDQSCYLHKCFNTSDVFTCVDNSKRMFSNVRCDNVKDCDDGSDEVYHCGEYLVQPILKCTSLFYLFTKV